jgi:ADP-ribosylation factor-like protein 6-interacting protein 1
MLWYEQSNDELSNLKKGLEGYRELILPLNKVIEWDQNYYPAVLVGVITLVFS